MILSSLIFQLFALLTGLLLAKKVIANNPSTLTFEEAYQKSKRLWVVSFLSITVILVNSFAFHYDAFFLTFPLLYQKYAMVITWVVIIAYLAFMSGFTLYITHKLEAKKFKTYLIALLILNVALFMNHYQKNSYGGAEVKKHNASERFIKQSTNFSCTSASVATIAKYFDINVS